MFHSVDTWANQATAQLDRFLSVQRAGLGCCEALTKLNTTTTRKLMDEITRHSDVTWNGSFGDLSVGVGKTVAGHWEACFGFALQSQQQLISSLGAPAQGASAKQK